MKKLKPSRLYLVFGFGLLHGMGFASVLREKLGDLSGGQIALPLVSFNVGVELAQITVLAVSFLILWPLRKWTSQFQAIGSILVAIAGLFGWVSGFFQLCDARITKFVKLPRKFEDAGLTGAGRFALLSFN